MTRLSDSLRGLADRAPIDDAVVSSASAARRIHRNRRLRAAANATAGVGAAAVVALAAINPTMGGTGAAADAAADQAAAPASAAPNGGRELYAADGAGTEESMLAWGTCGSYPFEGDIPNLSSADTLVLDPIDDAVKGGQDLTVDTVLTPGTSGDFEAYRPAPLVLWNGLVVGIGSPYVTTADIKILSTTAGEEVTNSVTTTLVNCWDGTPLPAGDYELVAVQSLTPVVPLPVTPPVEPSAEPAPEPTLGAPVEPTAVPGDPGAPSVDTPAPDQGAVDGASSGGSDSGAATSSIAADAPMVMVVSEPVAFTVAGDPVDDPFGQYLAPPVETVTYPEDYLDPATARTEYADRLTDEPWDMAEGTQRVVKANDSLTDSDPNAWLAGYFGCSIDSGAAPSFPAMSAEWPLVSVEASVPSAISVSYGWIVDDNPVVDFTVTNTSGYSLPGFWGPPSTSLYLLKDGKVAAQAYLPPIDPNSYATMASADGMLDDGATLSDTFVWRDISGCWTGTSAGPVPAGTYTLLTVQDIWVDNGGSMGVQPYYDDALSSTLGGAETKVAGAGDAATSLIAPAPDYGTYDSVNFQVWTSLGRITVS